MRTPESPTLAKISPLGRAIWRLVTPSDMDSLRPDVAGWLKDERWTQVETTYAEATAAMRKLAHIGSAHAALLPRFKKRAPDLFLFLCLTRREHDPLSNQRDFLLDIARLCAHERDICFGGLTEVDCRDLEVLVLEGARTDITEYEAGIRKLPAAIRASAATTWALLGASSAAPKLWCYNRFRLPVAPYSIGSTFACLATAKGGQDVCVQVSLRAIALSNAARQHQAIGSQEAQWDPCGHQVTDLDPIHVTTHEMIHAATTHKVEPWTGSGSQAYLVEAIKRLEEECDSQVVGVQQSGILPFLSTKEEGKTRLLLAVALNSLNEALTEAATIDILGLADPDKTPRAGRVVAYGRGVEFVYDLLSGGSARIILFSDDPIAAFVKAIQSRMTSGGADFMIDLIFDKSGSFAERDDLPKPLDDADAVSDARVYRLLAGVLLVDDERRAERRKTV